MNPRSALSFPGSIRTRRANEKLQSVLLRLAEGGPERQAIEAGEIDAVIDYTDSNIILFPAARRALAKPPAAPEPITNGFLAALSRPAYKQLHANLERVTLKYGDVLHKLGAPTRYVYFPVDSVVSLLAMAEDRRFLEIGLVGREGMVGISLALGIDASSSRAVVKASGMAMRMRNVRFQQAFRHCEPLRRALYSYAQVQLAVAGQVAACTSFHSVEERLARSLLMTSQRARSERIFLTQDFLADTLGVLRVAVTHAARSLRERKLISYGRANIEILDRKGLELASCRCYARIQGLHDGSRRINRRSTSARASD